MQISSLDTKMIQLLQDNARLSTAELARKLGVSRTTVHTRLGRLEQSGVIRGYALRLSSELEARTVKAHVMVTCAPRFSGAVEAALKAIPQVRNLMSVSGAFDMIVVLSASSVGELDARLDQIGALDGVERTTTSIILSTKLDR